jgi:hypothetical protein
MRNPRRPAFAASASTSAINGAAAASPAGHESANGLVSAELEFENGMKS